MLTKFKLKINDVTYDFSNHCVNNWENIACSFERSNLSGIVRSFTSQFEFIGEAYDLLLNHFNKYGFKAKAVFELYTINDNWEYQRAFYCDLDFSTISWTRTVLKINAIDNSIAAIIKANKSTKYEFIVGEDIPTTYPYYFDRLEVTETATYSITDGVSDDNGALSGTYKKSNNYRIYVGQIGKEIGAGGYMITHEDQEYGDGYMLNCIRQNTITVDYKIEVDRRVGCAQLLLMDRDNVLAQLSPNYNSAFCVQFVYGNIKVFNTIDEVKNYIENDAVLSHSWAVDTDLWRHRFADVDGVAWDIRIDANGNNEWNCTGESVAEYIKGVTSGAFTISATGDSKIWLKYDSEVDSTFCILSSEIKFSWKARGNTARINAISPITVIESIMGKMGACDVNISSFDKRLENTLILAAESIRGINNARLYTSFSDFCSWLETVFGYTYYIEEENNLLQFVHRRELFKDSAALKTIKNVVDTEYSVDESTLYYNVIVGYDKQDYDSVNGRDEFNFSNYYTTGFDITDKKIELKSKYRADSFGIELLVQKRSESTTDNESDEDVFFVLGRLSNGGYRTVRDVTVQSSCSNTLINGEFCPMACIRSNAEFIGMMADRLELVFTSSDGNSDVVIGDNKMSDSLNLENLRMLTSGLLKFKTDDVEIPKDLNSIIRINTSKCIYTGFIKKVEVRYSRQTSAEYTLLVKSKELC